MRAAVLWAAWATHGHRNEGDDVRPHMLSTRTRRASTAEATRLWPGCHIPYAIVTAANCAELQTPCTQRDRLFTPAAAEKLRGPLAAVAEHIHEQTGCTIAEGPGEVPPLEVVAGTECWITRVGYHESVQMQLGWCSTHAHRGSITHEFLHALGAEHEHQRADRDRYITVASSKDNCAPSAARTLAPYDFKSIMHYFIGTSGCGIGVTPEGEALLTRAGLRADDVGTADTMSQEDARGIRALYGTAAPHRPAEASVALVATLVATLVVALVAVYMCTAPKPTAYTLVI